MEEAELKACLASPPVISATVSPAVSSPPSPQKAEITVTVNESVSPEEEEEEEDEEGSKQTSAKSTTHSPYLETSFRQHFLILLKMSFVVKNTVILYTWVGLV